MKRTSLILLVLLAISCTCQHHPVAKKEKEVSREDVPVNIVRFDQLLFGADTNHIESDLAKIKNQYPVFFNVFYNQVLNLPALGDKNLQLEVMKQFVGKKMMRGLYDTVQQHFPNLDFFESDLKTLFTNYKSYFPEKPVPKVYTCITEFSYSVFTATDSIIGISLDKYLGKNYIYYPSVFSEYTFMIPTFEKKYMSVDCANVLAANLVPPPDDKSTLLDKMIAEGKILFIIQSLLPDKKESDIIKYSDKQWKWCSDNETQVWSYFLDRKLLYDTRFDQFKYVKDGPFTYGMPNDSPGRVGAWLGWKIVQAYMSENSGTTLKQLIAIKDGQKILTESKYKPKV